MAAKGGGALQTTLTSDKKGLAVYTTFIHSITLPTRGKRDTDNYDHYSLKARHTFSRRRDSTTQ